MILPFVFYSTIATVVNSFPEVLHCISKPLLFDSKEVSQVRFTFDLFLLSLKDLKLTGRAEYLTSRLLIKATVLNPVLGTTTSVTLDLLFHLEYLNQDM